MTWFDGIPTGHGLLERRILRSTLWLAYLTTVLAATPAFAVKPMADVGGPYTETASIPFNFDGTLSSNLDAAGKEHSQLSFNNSVVPYNDNVWTFSR